MKQTIGNVKAVVLNSLKVPREKHTKLPIAVGVKAELPVAVSQASTLTVLLRAFLPSALHLLFMFGIFLLISHSGRLVLPLVLCEVTLGSSFNSLRF